MNNTELINVILEYPYYEKLPKEYIDYFFNMFDYCAIMRDYDPFGISNDNIFVIGTMNDKQKYHHLLLDIEIQTIVPENIADIFYNYATFGNYPKLVSLLNFKTNDNELAIEFDNFKVFITYIHDIKLQNLELIIPISSYGENTIIFCEVEKIKLVENRG